MTESKRSMASGDDRLKNKKIKLAIQDEKAEITADEDTEQRGTGFVNLDENLLYEILKHVDARSLAMAASVSRLWNRTAMDERLWELICTRYWAQVGCSTQQLRSVVLALGGFRRLHSLSIWPLCKPPPSSPPSSSSSSRSLQLPRLTTAFSMKPPPKNDIARWGKDEVQLSLALLSIRYFEKMNFPVKDK